MKSYRIIGSLLLAILFFATLSSGVFAQSNSVTTKTAAAPEIKVTMKTDYPKIEVVSGNQVSFQVTLTYTDTSEGAQPKEFNLTTVLPQNWTGSVSNSSGTKIASINLDPTNTYGATVTVDATPSAYQPPSPGNYNITLEATSGNIKSSLQLTAVVTAQYTLTLVPSGSTPVYSTSATAGHNKIYPVTIENSGTAPIDNISLTSDAPQDWVITFPDQSKIDSLAANSQQALNVGIKPAPKAIAGDYMITIHASGTQATAKDLQVRVTVVTPSVWGWVGVAVIVIVVLALAFVFMRFSRR